MKLCVKYKITPSREQDAMLRNLGFYATKLYNTDNYIRREEWTKTGKIPSWYEQKKLLKDNHWYKLLPSQTAQRVCKNLQENYNSWFTLRKEDDDAQPPMFRKKEKLTVLSFYQQFKIVDDEITIGMSRKFKEETGVGNLTFKLDVWKPMAGLPKMANIINEDGKWLVHIVYEVDAPKPEPKENIMAIDIGVINLATTVDTDGNSTLYTGKQALAIQHYFNKEIAKLQSRLEKEQVKEHSEALSRIYKRKSRQINQILHTVTKNVIQEAKRNNVGTIIVGDLTNIVKDKKKGTMDKVSMQKLHSWGFSKLISQITYKGSLSGIRVEKISEYNTSKTCSVCGQVRKANRKKRGLYKCKNCGSIMNADVNGAKNILQKYLRENNISKSIGSVAEPLIWRCRNVIPS